MKIHHLFFTVLITFFSFALISFQDDPANIVVMGKSVGNIIIGKTTVPEIVKMYGKGRIVKHKKVYEQKKGYSTHKWITIEYEKIGLRFIAASEKTAVNDIEITLPFQAKTDKGIVLGKSQAADLIKLYGSPEERNNAMKNFCQEKDSTSYSCCDSVYYYPSYGIDFTIECETSISKGKVTDVNAKKETPSCSVVKSIHIYSSIRQNN